MEQRDLSLEIAKLVGEPINYQLPIPVELGEMVDFAVAESYEHVWRFTTLDSDGDEILDVDTTNGTITVKKRSPLGDTELTFKQLNSQLEYVNLTDIIGKPDVNVLARKKEAISRGMDKTELRVILNAIISDPGVAAGGVPTGSSITTITPATGEDLYDVIIRAKQGIEDYGDDLLMLAGSNVKKALDTYDKEKAGTFNYNVTVNDMIAKQGIKVIKVIGTVKNTGDSGQTALLDANKFIMIARNSNIANGKPIVFVRRKLDAGVADGMGLSVEALKQRAYLAVPSPVINDINGTTYNLLAYAVAGYESVIFAICNPYAICKTSDLSALL